VPPQAEFLEPAGGGCLLRLLRYGQHGV
jgi:hypothetical protein